jgi:DNA mismatch repair ATPase MutS
LAQAQNDDCVFLYQLVPGCSRDSYGRLCAAMAGIQENVLDRAAAISCSLAAGLAPEPAHTNAPCKISEKHESMLEQFAEMDALTGDAKAFLDSL